MKNIHILPTDKPSNLAYYQESTSYNKAILQIVKFESFDYKYQHIYITNDEEIKEGCYVPWKNQIFKVDSENAYSGTNNITLKYAKKHCKKIILTTDQDLIKDGVQAIDDEFLEWFCSKNGKVDFVEVITIEDEKN
jgi:hypothetical protein